LHNHLLLKKSVYNLKRLEWHLGVDANYEPRRVLCGLVVRQASLLISVNRLAVALAKSQDHRASCGVFAFGDLDRQGALANSLHGLNPRNTALISPVSKKRPALIERLVKQMGHGETTHLYKRINPSRALGALLFIYQLSLEKVNRLNSIHPWRTYV
jgi:hypothetical protein